MNVTDHPQTATGEDWFRSHVLPHEGLLRAWLRGQVASEAEVDDVVQEAFLRLIGQSQRGPIALPKAYLFATARNVLLARLRRSKCAGEIPFASSEVLDVIDEDEDVQVAVARSEELELLARAVQSLPDRCRRIITLRKIYGLGPGEVARALGITINTVQTQQAIAMRKLTEYFARAGSVTESFHLG